VSLLPRIAAYLHDRNVPCALIGGDALAVHGVPRATLDQDLLAVDARVLDAKTWDGLAEASLHIDIRRGDAEDPLRGVVRITDSQAERPLDLVVGRYQWQERAITRATVVALDDGGSVPVVQARDLVLLKLYAGGPQDAWDIQGLLAASRSNNATLREEVEADVSVLPRRCIDLWKQLSASHL
jgi:hypothetical protein